MALIEIDFLIFCFLGSLSQKGSRPLGKGEGNGYRVRTVVKARAMARAACNDIMM